MQGLDEAVRRNAFLAAVIQWWRDRRLKGRRSELDELDDHELARMAGELGITRADLVTLVEDGGQSAGLMKRMLASHHIAALDLERRLPEVYRDMAVHCAGCTEKGRCAHELDAGTAAVHAEQFCPNADTIRALLA
ncbi:DUF6455 family protein [Prosthecomicrobium sp. N25]|uniref:DUF6455 family protein n=1 Tax=Prosthecomicrobium sp. N25 TaxID=3129254 RepID=UPI003078A02B